MGMFTARTTSPGSAGAAYSSGTSSFPVTGFPMSAYRGNNRAAGGGKQSQPSPIAGAIGNAVAVDNRQLAITLAVVIIIGYGAWHLDNRKK